MRKKNAILELLLVFNCLIGCASVQSVSPIYLFTDATKSITLYLYDGRVISFSTGDYQVINQDGSSYISGSGFISMKGAEKQEKFLGRVNFRDIKEMKITEPPPTWQTTPLIVVGSLIFVLIVFISTFKVSNI
jgi:hypothetical protein